MNSYPSSALPASDPITSQSRSAAIARYSSEFSEYPGDVEGFSSFFLETDPESRIRKFMICALRFPSTEEGENRLLSLFTTAGGPFTDATLVPEFSGAEEGLVAETVRLLWDIREFGSGFHKHQGIAFWKQIRTALEECSVLENPSESWKAAIRKQYLPSEKLDDPTFTDSYYGAVPGK